MKVLFLGTMTLVAPSIVEGQASFVGVGDDVSVEFDLENDPSSVGALQGVKIVPSTTSGAFSLSLDPGSILGPIDIQPGVNQAFFVNFNVPSGAQDGARPRPVLRGKSKSVTSG